MTRKIIFKMVLLFGMLNTGCSYSRKNKACDMQTYSVDIEKMIQTNEIDSIEGFEMKLYISCRLIEGDSLQGITYYDIQQLLKDN